MQLLNRFFNARKERAAWEVGLDWFRLRYRDPAGPSRCLKLLSRPEAAGRLALFYRPGIVAELYVGLPQRYALLLQQMAADFDFSLQAKLPEVAIPGAQPLTTVAELPWECAFMAHITHEAIFAQWIDGEPQKGSYFPQTAAARPADEPAGWQLPAQPPAGLTQEPYWNGHQPPAQWVATRPDPQRWLLGRDLAGRPVQVDGRVNLYGRQEAVVDWLVQQVTHRVALNPAGLVVIDGQGNLVPRLKRKAPVTRLLGHRLAYLNLAEPPEAGGFNPLAPATGETETELMQRWEQWFQGMRVSPQGLELLVRARQDGVGDIPALQKWLKQAERQRLQAAISSLGITLNRLTAARDLREWLEWPANRFEILTGGALFLVCPGNSWAGQQLLRAALLGVARIPGLRLVIHGFPWKQVFPDLGDSPEQILISNGPLLPDSTVVLTGCHAPGAAALAGRFLAGDAYLKENLVLLRRGEGIVIVGDDVVLATWNGRGGQQEAAIENDQ